MQCPHCQHNGSKVVDSRPTDDNMMIRRRRECDNCIFRFTTFERIEVYPLLVIREDFNRDKILRGITRSVEKRPIEMTVMIKIVADIENKISSLGENEVSSQFIGECVIKNIADIDEISYIRFASVYRQFKNMDVFLKELKNVMKHGNTIPTNKQD